MIDDCIKLAIIVLKLPAFPDNKSLTCSNFSNVIRHLQNSLTLNITLKIGFDLDLSKVDEMLFELTRLNLVLDRDLGAARAHDLP